MLDWGQLLNISSISLQQRWSDLLCLLVLLPRVSTVPCVYVLKQEPYQSEIGTIWSSGWFPTI